MQAFHPQFSLLPAPEIEVLNDDESGRIVYRRALFEEEQARRWFEELRDGVNWRRERMWMYDHMVDVPRLVASYPLEDPQLPQAIREMRPAVEDFCSVIFTTAGLNFYRDGKDSVAPHGDHLEEALDKAPVALVSLGAVRRMTIRSKGKPRRTLDRDLEPGSLLVMGYESHFNFNHGVPKTKEVVGQRISVAFRRMPIGKEPTANQD